MAPKRRRHPEPRDLCSHERTLLKPAQNMHRDHRAPVERETSEGIARVLFSSRLDDGAIDPLWRLLEVVRICLRTNRVDECKEAAHLADVFVVQQTEGEVLRCMREHPRVS